MKGHRRHSDRSGRDALRSPGRPTAARREDLVRFWAAIGQGYWSEEAAISVGASPAMGVRWFRRAGGMPPTHLSQSSKPPSGRYLSFTEREEIAICVLEDAACARSPVNSSELHPRSRGNCAVTPPRVVAVWNIGPPLHNGTPTDQRAVPNRQSWRSTRLCSTMCIIGWPVLSPLRTGQRSMDRTCHGRAAGQGADSTGDGLRRGARNKSHAAYGSTFPTMRRCASVTKPSIKRCTYKGAARCAAS